MDALDLRPHPTNCQPSQSAWRTSVRALIGVSSNSFCFFKKLTIKVLVTTIDAQWDGMGDVGSARYEPALLPPCPTKRVLTCSKFSEIQHFKG